MHTTNQDIVRIVLRPQADWRDVQTTGRNRDLWELWDFTRQTQEEPHRTRWKSVDGKCVITYYQDPLRELRYYQIIGSDLETHANYIRSRVPSYQSQDINEFIRIVNTTSEKIAIAYYAAAFAEPKPQPIILDFLLSLLKDDDASVRRAAIDATLVAHWLEFQQPLLRISLADSDPAIRRFARETLSRLTTSAWNTEQNIQEFVPLPPDRRRITPLTGVRDQWYRSAFGREPPLRPDYVPNHKSKFQIPTWLLSCLQSDDWSGFEPYSPTQVIEFAGRTSEYIKPPMVMPEHDLLVNRELWQPVVPVAFGPLFTDRCRQTDYPILYINRDNPDGLLLSVGDWHPPNLWIPIGQDTSQISHWVDVYLSQAVPPQSRLTCQGRVFLGGTPTFGSDYTVLPTALVPQPFLEKVYWGSSQKSDPYPVQIPSNMLPAVAIDQLATQSPNGDPWYCYRTRYSKSIIQFIYRKHSYFANLYYQPGSPPHWIEAYNARHGTNFPPEVPIDVVGSLVGLACLGAKQILWHAKDVADASYLRELHEAVDFLRRAPKLN